LGREHGGERGWVDEKNKSRVWMDARKSDIEERISMTKMEYSF
jgi:hypothetical protein